MHGEVFAAPLRLPCMKLRCNGENTKESMIEDRLPTWKLKDENAR